MRHRAKPAQCRRRRSGPSEMWCPGGAHNIAERASTWRQRVLGCLRVLVREARRRRHPSVGISVSQSYPGSVGVFIIGEGRVELCPRRVFQDMLGLGFRWIRLDLAGFHGLWSFYRPFSAFSSSGRRFSSQFRHVNRTSMEPTTCHVNGGRRV